jgi:hypothetical protein
MSLLRNWLASSAIVLFSILPTVAEEQSASASKTPDSPLTSTELKNLISIDSLTIPTPGEFFKAIEKGGKPNWASQYRPPISVKSTSRAQVAFSLGTLIADGYIAVEAQDGQQVKNVGKDVLALATKLSVSQSVLARGASLTQFAENNAWDQLNEELEATQNEVKKALEENRDSDLITLVSVGGWIRGTEVVTGLILQKYSPDDAKLLRQPALVSFLQQKLGQLPERLQKDSLVEKVNSEIGNLQKLVSFPPDHVPTPDEVKNINLVAAKLTTEISTPK